MECKENIKKKRKEKKASYPRFKSVDNYYKIDRYFFYLTIILYTLY